MGVKRMGVRGSGSMRVQWECELNHLAAAQQIAEVEVEQDDPQ